MVRLEEPQLPTFSKVSRLHRRSSSPPTKPTFARFSAIFETTIAPLTGLGNGKSRRQCRSLQLQLLAYNLSNFIRTLALPKAGEPWSLTSLLEKLGHAHPRPRQNRHMDKHVPVDGSVLITTETTPERISSRLFCGRRRVGIARVYGVALLPLYGAAVIERFGIDDNRAAPRERFSALLTVRKICAVPPPIVNRRSSPTMRSSGRLRE